jgi:hypothetical protein
LATASELAVLGGANVGAISADGDTWEVMQFLNAQLVAPQTYMLTGLMRGQAGTELAMGSPTPAGAQFVLIDASTGLLDVTLDQIGRPLQL